MQLVGLKDKVRLHWRKLRESSIELDSLKSSLLSLKEPYHNNTFKKFDIHWGLDENINTPLVCFKVVCRSKTSLSIVKNIAHVKL